MLVASELVPDAGQIALLDCDAPVAGESLELKFELITTDPDPDELRRLLSRDGTRVVVFEWDPATGELAYDVAPRLTPQAADHAAASGRRLANCGPR
jgi:hypothetical protein